MKTKTSFPSLPSVKNSSLRSLLSVPSVISCSKTFSSWLSTVRDLASFVKLSPWLIGDLLNAGQTAYGEKYSQALALFDLEPSTLRNICWVCRTFQPSRRQDNLSFTHHLDVASATDDPRAQDRLLHRAAKEHWTRSQLRIHIRQSNATEPRPSGSAQRITFLPANHEREYLTWFEDQLQTKLTPDRRTALATQLDTFITRLQKLRTLLRSGE